MPFALLGSERTHKLACFLCCESYPGIPLQVEIVARVQLPMEGYIVLTI